MTDPLLRIENMDVSYIDGDSFRRVVKGVSLDIRRNEVLGIVGQSGSGKSTLIKAVLRILPPPGVITGGRALYKGMDLLDEKGLAIQKLRWVDLSIVMQSALNALNPLLTIGDHFVDTLQQHTPLSHRESIEAAKELVAQVRLPERVLESHPHMLSGGMRQRVCIALALALKPDLVFLDECTTALDVIVEREIFDEMLALREQLGFAILAITHDLPLLAEIADRVAIMADGELVDLASVDEFRRGGSHPESQRLLAELPNVHGPTREGLLPRKPTAPDAEVLLDVRGLHKKFPQPSGPPVHAVKNVSLQIRKGETLALIGESGSGKSTTSRIIARLLTGNEGEILLSGEHLQKAQHRRCPKGYRRRVQMVFQDPFASLNPVYTIGEHLARPLKRHGIAKGGEQIREKSIELLEQVELHPAEEILGRFPHELSGGQQQRVSIARSLAMTPDLLITDEPTSMLDLPIRMGLLRTLNRIREERGMSILFVSHDLAAARYFSDRVLVMQDGEIVEAGPTEAVTQSPKHPYTKRLLLAASRPKLDPQ
ncbi:MAG: ABC transporter ATP-binding protein [Myxococcota bacterium]|nr:ABC transporter ATP-binding protein [Myxococcota bacterium]